MRVIFLDIDGVVNTFQIYKEPYKDAKLVDGFYIDICSTSSMRVSNEQAVMWLNKICIECNAKIVISSTWRYSGLENIKNSLYNSGLLKEIEIIGMTPILHEPHLRGDEIRLYLADHKEIDDFIIIDDDSDMLEFSDRLVKTNTYVGITLNEFIKAKELFGV